MLARALYDNTADFADELTFRRGDTLVVIERDLSGAPGWWLCSLGGRQGIVPANRLQLIAVRDQDDLNNNTSSAVVKNRGYFYQPLTTADDQRRQQQQQQACYLISPVSSSLSPASSTNLTSSSSVPPVYISSESDPSPALLLTTPNSNDQAENIYENFASAESENLYEDPTLWSSTTSTHRKDNNTTPTMLKQSFTVRTGLPATSTTQVSPNSGLLVTTTAHHRVNQGSSDTAPAYQAGSTDSGVYSHPPSNRSNVGDYAEDIYDYPAAFQQMQAKFEQFAAASSSQQEGIYDMVPGPISNEQLMLGDYDFVQMSPGNRQQFSPSQQQLGDYDALPIRIPVEVVTTSSQPQFTPIGDHSASSESMETIPEFSPAECEKAFENRRNAIERLVRFEHAVTRAATRWSRLFGSSGWRKSSFLNSNSYAIQTSGEQLAHAMTTFAAYAAAALSRLDFPTFATLASLRQAYEPLYIEATNFKKYLNSVGHVNWTLENAAPHLTKTFEVMLHSQRTFLTNLSIFSNVLKRADFTTISSTAGSTHSLAPLYHEHQQPPPPPLPAPQSPSSTLNRKEQQQQHRTYMVVKDVSAPPTTTPIMVVQHTVPADEPPPTPRQAQRGISTVHIHIPATSSSSNNNAESSSSAAAPLNKSATTSTLTGGNTSSNVSTLNRQQHQQKSLRFAEDVELVNQLAGDLEQRIGELSFVVSTFVLSLRRTQPSAYKPEIPDGQRFNGGFIECGKLLVNVAHSVVIIGDKLSTIVTEPDRSEAIKMSTDRLRVCIRVFVEKLKSLAGAGSRSASAVDDLITHVEVLRSQAETIKHRLDSHNHNNNNNSNQSLSTPTATLNR